MHLKHFCNLQVKVTLAFLLVSLVPLGTASFFSVRTANEVVVQIVQNQLENVAAEKQVLLERWLAEREADLAVLAGSPAIREMNPEKAAPFLDLACEQYGVYRHFLIADANGVAVYDSLEPTRESWADEPWFREALGGAVYMSGMELEAGGTESVFHLAVPVPDATGQTQGVLRAVVSTQAIVKRVLRVQLGTTGECYLVDKEGTFLAHKDPKRILNENIAQSGSFQHVFEKVNDRLNIQPVYTDYRGIQVLGASRRMGDYGWYVVVEQDRDEAFAAAHQLQRHIWMVILATVVGALGFSGLLAWSVASPIRRLSEVAGTLARGDFEHAMVDSRTTRCDEIGVLYAAFAHMADQLNDRQSHLQTQVGLTEAELQKVEARLKGTLDAAGRSERLAALGRLAAGVAHEIRTPLTSLKLFLQSVQEDIVISPELTKDYQIAMRQVARIEKTINHFLDFARPRDPVLVDLDFAELLDDVLEVIRPRANQQEVDIHVSVAPNLPGVRGDVRQLGEGLVNLMVNALDSIPDGGRLSIAITSETASLDGATLGGVRIDVSDTGPGIRDRDLARLFEPFFTTKAAGSGLGLAILKGTIERHGGRVTVDTHLGSGTTFSLHLPTTPPPTTPPPTSPPPIAPPPTKMS